MRHLSPRFHRLRYLPAISLMIAATSCNYLANYALPETPTAPLSGAKPAPTEVSPSLGGSSAPLVAAGVQFIVAQALESQCDQGETAACKIAFALDPAYQTNDKIAELNQSLEKMNALLSDIYKKTDAIDQNIKELATQLEISVADLKLDISNAFLNAYLTDIVNAYRRLQEMDFSDGKKVNVLQFLESVYIQTTDAPYMVIHNLNRMHQLIMDNDGEPGLLGKMDQRIQTRVEGLWKTGRPTAAKALELYQLQEEYFGHLLIQQAKGFVVMSAAYKALDEIEKNGSSADKQGAVQLRAKLTYHNFAEFQIHYDRQIEEQVQTFLKYVERFISYTADVNQPGVDSQGEDIGSWASVVLKRASFLAAWARYASTANTATVKPPAGSPAQSPTAPPAVLAVHVIGEPDRFALLHEVGSVELHSPAVPFATDTRFMNPIDNGQVYRRWPTRPYMQFPMRLNEPAGSLKREGTMKGANALMMKGYVLTEKFLPITSGENRQLKLRFGRDQAGNPYDLEAEMDIERLGPDGRVVSRGQSSEPAIYFGHTTVLLKETAARRGTWSLKGPTANSNQTLQNLTVATEGGRTDYPQATTLKVHADPRFTSGTDPCPSDRCPSNEHAKGKGDFQQQLIGEYFFEGWGDVPDSAHGKVKSVLKGTKSDTVNKKANYGAYSLLMGFGVTHGTAHQSVSTTESAVKQEISQAFSANTPVTYILEPRITMSWDLVRRSFSTGCCTFDGSNRFEVISLVPEVLPSP